MLWKERDQRRTALEGVEDIGGSGFGRARGGKGRSAGKEVRSGIEDAGSWITYERDILAYKTQNEKRKRHLSHVTLDDL